MHRRLSTLVLAAALAASCAAPAAPETVFPVTMTLQAGQRQSAGGLIVTFVGVSNDWRCPAAAICITAGDAYLQFTLSANNRATTQQLQVEHPDNRRARYEGFSIEVQKLEPFPITFNSIKPEEYRVTINVSR